MTLEEQELLQVKTIIKPSPIHGVGVFALFNVKKGDKLFCEPTFRQRLFELDLDELDIPNEIKAIIRNRWAYSVNDNKFMHPNDDVPPVFFMNHSEDPNYDFRTDTALRDIAKGEELTENYKLMPNYKKAYPFLE